jgi:hypothetical protein
MVDQRGYPRGYAVQRIFIWMLPLVHILKHNPAKSLM